MFSEATLARFAREVAKYPADQKQSAVMACLAIVQQEQGHVSAENEKGVAAVLGMPPIAVEFGRRAVRAEHQIGIEPEQAVAPTHFAALH